MEKRKGRKAAAEKYEPIKGHFPGADSPLAVAQIDHTPMDVIVVDEEHRQPIQRPFLTVVIDVYSRRVLGFAIYLEKPSAFTAGLAIAHAVLPKEHWLADVGVGVRAEWPCWGKMRAIHCDNAKEFRGTVIGRACQDHDIAIEHRPPREPRYGGHIERGFGTQVAQNPSNELLEQGLGSLAGGAGAYRLLGELQKSADDFRQSIGIRERLLRNNPSSTSLRRSLMIVYGNYAVLLAGPQAPNLENPPPEARVYGERSVALARLAVASDANDVTARRDLSTS